jgi:nucleoside-diphosphate-sugar epimerase
MALPTVLITGATGFLGRHCLPLLLRCAESVHATSRRPPLGRAAEVHWHQTDLLDVAQVARLVAALRPTHLLHLAWETTPGKYGSSAENLAWLASSLHLLRAFASHGGRRVVVAGTCAEYDWDHGYCSEGKTPLAPATLYGKCKGALRSVLEGFAALTELSQAWGRLFYLYGPHEHPDRFVASVIRRLLAGETAPCTAGTQRRDYLHVQDAAEALVTLLASNVTGAVNIASGQPTAVGDIARLIGQKIGRTHLLALGAQPLARHEPPLLVADVRRLRTELDWQPQFDLDRGLAQTIGWWQEAREGADDA